MIIYSSGSLTFDLAGEVGEPRPGAAQPAAAHGEEPHPEPLPLPGLLCAQPGVQRHVLHPGAAGRLHQPPQRPLDPPRLRSPAAQPHLLVRPRPQPAVRSGAPRKVVFSSRVCVVGSVSLVDGALFLEDFRKNVGGMF